MISARNRRPPPGAGRLLSAAARLARALAAVAVLPGTAGAQPPPQPVSQFTIVGFLQEATLDATDALAGGTLTVNGHQVIVPRNTVVQMPATALTWQELFALAPPPYAPTQTGLALRDSPAPLTTFEVQVVGNRVGDRYIAGLVSLSQELLGTGQGYVNAIDYARGELRVGGVLGDARTGTRVRLDDPLGRFGRAASPDVRFTVDEDNPTVRSATGFPMCVPRTDPAVSDDPACPQANRPRDGTSPTGFAMIFTMPFPSPGQTPDATRQAPFEIGDHVTYAGTIVRDGPQPTAGPLAATDTTYVSAWSVIANVGISTWPGADPAYVAIDVTILGAGGASVAGAVEATTRTRFEGFTTDPTRPVDLYGVDVDPCTGRVTDRFWGSVDVDLGPPTGAVRGRWRFRPPTGALSLPASGSFLPPTREVRARIRSAAILTAAGGLAAGQYRAPISTYLFPENAAVGAPMVPNDLESFPFLAQGSGPWPGGGPNPVPGGVVGQLSPWPGLVAPLAASCGIAAAGAPVANAGRNQSVASTARVTLDGSGSGDPGGQSLTFAWTQTAGPAVTLSSAAAARPAFDAPLVPSSDPPLTLTFALVVTNLAGLASPPSTVDVVVSPAGAALAPLADAGGPRTVASGLEVTLDGTASVDPNVPPLALAYAWTQVAPLAPDLQLTAADTATPSFVAPLVPPGAPLVVTFQLVVTNTAGLSAVAKVDVTVAPVGEPIANPGVPRVVLTGAAVALDGSGSFDPAGLPLTYAWTQLSGPAVALSGTSTSTPTFTAPALAPGAPPVVLAFALTVGNGYVTSTAAPVTVTVFSIPDTVVVVSAVYRVSQQRLTVTATSSVDGALLSLVSPTGGPAIPLTLVAGVPTADVRGVPEPTSVAVVSSVGGRAISPITRVQ